jgi:hypothetical protein
MIICINGRKGKIYQYIFITENTKNNIFKDTQETEKLFAFGMRN